MRITELESFRNNQGVVLNDPNRQPKGDKRYWTSENVPIPLNKGGRQEEWADLPFDTISVGTVIGIPLTSEQKTQRMIRNLRSLAWRRGQSLQKKFSARVTEYGMGIWRIE